MTWLALMERVVKAVIPICGRLRSRCHYYRRVEVFKGHFILSPFPENQIAWGNLFCCSLRILLVIERSNDTMTGVEYELVSIRVVSQALEFDLPLLGCVHHIKFHFLYTSPRTFGLISCPIHWHYQCQNNHA